MTRAETETGKDATRIFTKVDDCDVERIEVEVAKHGPALQVFAAVTCAEVVDASAPREKQKMTLEIWVKLGEHG